MHHQRVIQVEKTGWGSVSVLKKKIASFTMQVAEQDDVLNACV